ncbi:MAG: hypothetical protein WB816_13965 [Methylocystis sp.]
MHDEKALPPARHEQSDVGMRFIAVSAVTLVISIVSLALLVLWLFPKATLDRTLQLPLPRFPRPRLQTSPRDDMAAFRHAEMERLNSAGWIDQAKGVAHIPITVAMRKIMEDKIPGWPGGAPALAPVAHKELPQATQTVEGPHEAVRSIHSVYSHAAHGKCWIDSRSRRHCVRAKERRGAATGHGIAR